MAWLDKVWLLLAALLGALVGWLVQRKTDSGLWKKISQDLQEEARREEKRAEEVDERQKERERRNKELSDWLDKLPVVAILILALTCPVHAAELPRDYDLLLSYYQEMSQIAREYKELYEAAERDVSALLESNKRLGQLVEEQQKIIAGLLKKDRLALSAGVTLVGDGIGLVTVLTYNF